MAQRLIECTADELDEHVRVVAIGAQKQAIAPVCEPIPIPRAISCHGGPQCLGGATRPRSSSGLPVELHALRSGRAPSTRGKVLTSDCDRPHEIVTLTTQNRDTFRRAGVTLDELRGMHDPQRLHRQAIQRRADGLSKGRHVLVRTPRRIKDSIDLLDEFVATAVEFVDLPFDGRNLPVYSSPHPIFGVPLPAVVRIQPVQRLQQLRRARKRHPGESILAPSTLPILYVEAAFTLNNYSSRVLITLARV
ncbi:hypothetical protein SAMN06272775_5967 [Streptomyces sp. 2323.1]|nr:hypothetical protein SAMN06272775_5967 [Streptomyces sp. 2323.1]